MKSRRLGAALGMVSLLAAAMLFGAGLAGATTIGQLAPDPYTQEAHEGYYGPPPYYYYYPPYTTNVYHPPPALCETAQDYLQASVTAGSAYVVPAKGEEITSWSTNATLGAGQELSLKVFRRVAETSSYEVVGHDGPRTLTPAASANGHGQLNTFSGLSIPVQPGDIIGLFPNNAGTVHDACMSEAGGGYMSSGANLGDASSGPFTSAAGMRLNLTAEVQLTPQAGTHNLTVTKAGSGYGTVQSSPTGIEACSSSCTYAFSDSTVVTLTPSPDSYSAFTGWSGGCTGTGACQVTIGANTAVTATFEPGGGSAPTYGYDYENGYGPGYGPPGGGESGGGSPGAVHAECKKPKRGRAKARKPHCAKTQVVAKRAHNAGLGTEVLTARNGHTLYSLSAEGGGNFICTAGCLSVWHPLTVPTGIRPLGPVKLGTVTRSGVGVQVTYHGKPLYTFAEDLSPGDAHGQGIKDVGTWGAVVVPAPKPGH